LDTNLLLAMSHTHQSAEVRDNDIGTTVPELVFVMYAGTSQ